MLLGLKTPLHGLLSNHVLVPAEKAANNVACKEYYTGTIIEELGNGDTYEAILKSRNQFMTLVEFKMSEEDQNLI